MLVSAASGFACPIPVLQLNPHGVSHESDPCAGFTRNVLSLNVLQNHIPVNHPNLTPPSLSFHLYFSVNLKTF